MEQKEMEKLCILLDHWIKHNSDHVKVYEKWAHIAGKDGLKDVAQNIKDAAYMISQSSEKFIAAKKGMPVSSVAKKHMHDPHAHDFTREYEVITNVIDRVKSCSMNIEVKRCSGCENLNKCSIPYADALHYAFLESKMPCRVFCRKIEDGIDCVSHEIVEARNNHTVQVFFNFLGCEHPLCSYQAVYKKHRLNNLYIENTEGPQTDESEFGILKCHRVPGSPLQVGEYF